MISTDAGMTKTALVVACALLVACNTDSDDNQVPVTVGFIAPTGTAFTATLDGHTYTEKGPHIVRLELDRTYELVGTFTGGALGVTFTGSLVGGVRLGSVESLEGPVGLLSPCDISYVAPASGTYNFRIRFQTTRTEHCIFIL